MLHSDLTDLQRHNHCADGPDPADAVILRHVAKTYRRGREQVAVLQDLDLRIAQGEFAALMGPSGSGKTTILNLIGGLDRAQAGAVIVAGEQLEMLSPAALTRWRGRHIGFVFQFYNLMPMLSAATNVELPLLNTRLSRAERRAHVEAALKLVGLEHRAAHKPGEMSGGQQQRVGIARAIVTDPTILLCDEPTGDLDRKSADEILTLLRMLNREQGKTIVMVTHDQKAAEFAGRELHLDKGTLSGTAGT
jgi:putative ABC transport system ATP-binding protein